ncbi:MAG: hypothetical protein ACQES4_01945 [Bacillota bacterium]
MLENIATLLVISLIITGACIKLINDKKNGIKCSGCPHSKICNQDCHCSDQLLCKPSSEINNN